MRRISKPDLRPSWRDPNLPCIRKYKMGDGSIKEIVDPDYERRYREFLMQTAPHPEYKDDPTYNWAKKNARHRR